MDLKTLTENDNWNTPLLIKTYWQVVLMNL